MSDDEGVALLVIRTARWRTLASIAVSAIGVVVVFGVWGWVASVIGPSETLAVVTADPFSTAMTAFVSLIVLAMLGHSVHRHFRSDTLTLSAQGFRIKMSERSRFVRWSDVKQFRAERPKDSMYAIVGWDHHDDAPSGNPVWQNPNVAGVRATTLDAEIGSDWERGPDALCSTLEDWRSRYATDFPPREDTNLEDESVASSAMEAPVLLTVRADRRKAIGPLLGVWACLLGLFALPIWVTALAAKAGEPSAMWASMAARWSFWLAALPYAALGLLIGYYVWLLTRRILMKPTLVLTPDGLEVKDEAGIRFTRWSEIEAFGVAYCSRNYREHVGWRYKPGVVDVDNWNKPASDLDVSLGMGWQGSPRDLRNTLETWRRRYGDR